MLSSILGKAHKFLLKWPGLFGLPFYFFFAKAAVTAKALDPHAGLGDIAGEFYGNVTDAACNHLLPGIGIILSETFNFAADTLVPGLGTALGVVFGGVAGVPAPKLVPSLAPGF